MVVKVPEGQKIDIEGQLGGAHETVFVDQFIDGN